MAKLTKQQAKMIEELLTDAKEVSGKAMKLVVHMHSQEAIDHAKAFMKGKRGFKNVSLKLTKPIVTHE